MRLFPTVACVLALVVGACSATTPTAPSGQTGRRVTTKTAPSPAATAAPSPTDPPGADASTYFGLVLDQNGQPAANVPVTGYLLSNNGGGLISDKGASLIGNNAGNYRLLDDALATTTDAQGHFTLRDSKGRPLNVEAVASADSKAIAFGVASDASGVKLQLAPTGTLSGTVTASDTAVTNLIGVDVFVPGTSYQAQTDANGNFTISNMPAGTFSLYATKTGVGQALVTGAVVKSSQSSKAPPIVLVPSIPTVSSLSVHDGAPGAPITIKGDKFGATEGKTFSVTIGGAAVTSPNRVDDQTIQVKVPQGARSGDLIVTVDGIPSAPQHFRVWSALAIATPQRYFPEGRAFPLALDAVDTEGVHAATATVDWTASGTASVDASGTLTMTGASATVSVRSGELAATPVALNGETGMVVDTVAGDATSNDKDGLGSAAEFYFPMGLTRASDGNYYVVDEWNEAVRKLTPGGQVTTLVGKDSSGQSPLEWPVAIGTAPDGGLDVVDENGDHVVHVTLDGKTSTLVSATQIKAAQNATTSYLDGLAVAPDGTLYVSDSWNNDILKISNGQVSVLAGDGTYKGGTADGTGTQAQFKQPHGLALDGQGDLYVADTGNNALRKIVLANGQVSTLTLSGASLTTPFGLAFDKAGNLYVTNQMGGQVLKVQASGATSVFAGTASFDGLSDGPVATANFGYTFGLCFTPDGDLYVTEGSDGNANRIREILMP